MKKNKFTIGDKVYHRAPESQASIVIEIAYYFSSDTFQYLVAESYDKNSWCKEIELSEIKTF